MVKTTVERRDGEESPKKLRRKEMIPAVIYGPERNTESIKIEREEFQRISQKITRSSRINLNLERDGANKVFLKDIQYNHLTDEPIHIDFYEVPDDHTVKMDVPVTTTGKAEGVSSGGILDRSMETLTVKGNPADIPEIVKLNVEELTIGDSIHVSDLQLEGVDILNPPGNSVVSILSPRKEIDLQEELAETPSLGLEEEAEELMEEEEEEFEEGEEAEEELEEGEEAEEEAEEEEVEEETE